MPATTLPTDMQLRICATVAWSCSPNTLSGLFWNWRACGLSARDRICGVRGLPRQVLLARGVTERAPDRHRPLAWPHDSAVGIEAGFASHFPRTLLVWIGSVHALHLAIAACRRNPADSVISLR